jgi:hypothetical protein
LARAGIEVSSHDSLQNYTDVLFHVSFSLVISHILSKDPYIGPIVVELPPEVAKWITIEEHVTDININRLQEGFVELLLTWRLPFQCQSINKNHNLKPVV